MEEAEYPLANLAILLKNTNRMDEAEPLYRRAMTIWEDSLGQDHPLTIRVQTDLDAFLEIKARGEE